VIDALKWHVDTQLRSGPQRRRAIFVASTIATLAPVRARVTAAVAPPAPLPTTT
jgi:hypothetical protein